MDLDAEFLELARNHVGRTEFLERRFRMGVQITPPFGHLVVNFFQAVSDVHGGTSRFLRAPMFHILGGWRNAHLREL